MNEVVVFANLTLDGVMQAPGRPDEDRRGGFFNEGMPSTTLRLVNSQTTTNGVVIATYHPAA